MSVEMRRVVMMPVMTLMNENDNHFLVDDQVASFHRVMEVTTTVSSLGSLSSRLHLSIITEQL
jgi:hypothetical protein